MKVVLVTSIPAFPTTAGNRSRIRELARAVMEMGHDLTFVQLPESVDTGDAAAHEAAYGKDRYILLGNGGTLGHVYYRARKKIGRQLRKALIHLGVEAAYYHGLDEDYHFPWARQLARIGQNADVVIVEYVFNSEVLHSFPKNVRRIIDTHDSFGERHRAYSAQGMRTGYWGSLTAADENRGFRRADTLLAIQPEEARGFREQLAKDGGHSANPDVGIVSHFLDTADPVTDFSAGHTAIFLASNNPSNRQAIQDFTQNVLPLVVGEMPDFELKLVGTICNVTPDNPNITKLGRVENLREAFVQAPLSVNPMLLGTGINIKLLDAMAAGVPTISTETGLRGLPEAFRNGVVVVRDRDYGHFSSEILRYASDEALRWELGQTAHTDATRWNAEQASQLDRCLTGEPRRAEGKTSREQ